MVTLSAFETGTQDNTITINGDDGDDIPVVQNSQGLKYPEQDHVQPEFYSALVLVFAIFVLIC